MNEELKGVADRLKGLREIMDVSVETAAQVCGITPAQYASYETGLTDIPVSVLHSMAKKYNFEVHDQDIFDYLRSNNPEYLVNHPELAESSSNSSNS